MAGAFSVIRTEREGDWRYSGDARVVRTLQTDLPRARACELLENQLRGWTRSVEEGDWAGDYVDAQDAERLNRCSFHARLLGNEFGVEGFVQDSDGTVDAPTMVVLWVSSS